MVSMIMTENGAARTEHAAGEDALPKFSARGTDEPISDWQLPPPSRVDHCVENDANNTLAWQIIWIYSGVYKLPWCNKANREITEMLYKENMTYSPFWHSQTQTYSRRTPGLSA